MWTGGSVVYLAEIRATSCQVVLAPKVEAAGKAAFNISDTKQGFPPFPVTAKGSIRQKVWLRQTRRDAPVSGKSPRSGWGTICIVCGELTWKYNELTMTQVLYLGIP